MLLEVPEEGLAKTADTARVREATLDDIPAMAEFDAISGICRQKDYRHFIENREGIWGSLVYQGLQGIEGFMFSSKHPASNMVGPGVMRDRAASGGACCWPR